MMHDVGAPQRVTHLDFMKMLRGMSSLLRMKSNDKSKSEDVM